MLHRASTEHWAVLAVLTTAGLAAACAGHGVSGPRDAAAPDRADADRTDAAEPDAPACGDPWSEFRGGLLPEDLACTGTGECAFLGVEPLYGGPVARAACARQRERAEALWAAYLGALDGGCEIVIERPPVGCQPYCPSYYGVICEEGGCVSKYFLYGEDAGASLDPPAAPCP